MLSSSSASSSTPLATQGSLTSAAISASTIRGSNCVPLQRSSSSIASSTERARAVGPRRRHRVERVGHGDDPGELGDLLRRRSPIG